MKNIKYIKMTALCSVTGVILGELVVWGGALLLLFFVKHPGGEIGFICLQLYIRVMVASIVTILALFFGFYRYLRNTKVIKKTTSLGVLLSSVFSILSAIFLSIFLITLELGFSGIPLKEIVDLYFSPICRLW